MWPYTNTLTLRAWDKLDAKGGTVKVGIVDAGRVYAKHEDLNVAQTFGGNIYRHHATHVGGLACAKANGRGVVGYSWGCPIVNSGWGDGHACIFPANATPTTNLPRISTTSSGSCSEASLAVTSSGHSRRPIAAPRGCRVLG